jgi:hypothetical protein
MAILRDVATNEVIMPAEALDELFTPPSLNLSRRAPQLERQISSLPVPSRYTQNRQ